MAAWREQIPAPPPIAAPGVAPDPAPDSPADGTSIADGEVPGATAVAGGCPAGGEVLQGAGLQRDSPSPVVPRQGDGGAKDEDKTKEERQEMEDDGEEAEDARRGGGGGDAGGVGKRGERKGALFLPDAKRRKASPAALERLPTTPAAEDSAAAERGCPGGGGGGREGAAGCGETSSPPFAFSFSFDTRGFGTPPIETTPKFGSFNFAALSSAAAGAEPLGAAAGGGDEVRGQDAEAGAP